MENMDTDIYFGMDFLVDNEEKQLLRLREGELREVAVLFADIKGFTNISNLFAPEVIHGKMDEIMKIFTRCINFYGGFVDKYMGDGIMALFGAKKATEHDTERCVLAAIKMQEQLRLYNNLLVREPGFETVTLGLRIGINTGLVSVGKVGQSREGDFTVYGPQVNLASRMESNAPVNRIMMPKATRDMVSHIFDFEPQGLVSVKGMDEPIDCWLVIGQKTEPARTHQATFIGRETELETLQQITQKATSGLQVVGIKGDAGIGKSRLILEYCNSLTNSIVLQGICSSISPSPFNLFTKILETYFQISHNSQPVQKKQQLENAIKQLASESTNPDAVLDTLPLIGLLMEIRYEDARLKLKGQDLLDHLMKALDTVLSCIIAGMQNTNDLLIIIADDLHVIDESSSHLLKHLIGKLETLYVMLICMYRLDHHIPEYIVSHYAFQEMEIRALSNDQINTLLRHYTQDLNIKEDTLKQVSALSAGNPFFLEEWCNYISHLPQTGEHEYPVPGNLHALILSRLDNLPTSLRLLLHKASVIGHEFFVDILREVESRLQDPVDVDTTLIDLENHSLIMKMLGFDFSTYFFKHMTTREVAYQTLLQQNRKLLHQLTAETIEFLFGDRLGDFVHALADHYLKAEIPDKALPYLEKAFAHAMMAFDNASALKYAARLLEVIPPEDTKQRAKILIQAADINQLIGNQETAYESIQAAAELIVDTSIQFCEIHRFLGVAAFYQGDMTQALDSFQAGYDLALKYTDKYHICVACNNLGIWYQHQKDFDTALNHHNRSLDLAKELNDPKRQAKTLSNLGLVYMEQDDFDKAEQAFSQSLDLAVQNRLMRDESIALGNLGWVYLNQGRMEEALDFLNRKLTMAKQMDDKQEIGKALGNISTVYLAQERYEEALTVLDELLKLNETLGDEDEIQSINELISEVKQVLS